MAAMRRRSLAGVILNGLPPSLPRARAEARPANVRSAINSRSNSASAAKIPKTSLPAGPPARRGVDGRAVPRQHFQADVAPRQIMNGIDQMAQVAPESIQLPHD